MLTSAAYTICFIALSTSCLPATCKVAHGIIALASTSKKTVATAHIEGWAAFLKAAQRFPVILFIHQT